MNVKEPIREDSTNVIIRKNSDWSEGAVGLLGKWERICTFRKKAHYSASNDYGWKNKFLSIPIIVISTILGSLSFIHPSFIDKAACSRRLSLRNLQPEWPACVCDSYLNGAASSESDLCMKAGTTECYPMNPEDWSCPGDMFACINMDVPTEAPTPEPDGYVPELDNGPDNCCTHSAPWDDQFTLMCQTCAYDVLGEGQTGITYKWYDNDAVQFQLTCSAMGGSDDKVFCSGQNNQNGGHPSYMATCEETCLASPTSNPTFHPTKTPTTAAPTTTTPTAHPTFFPTPTVCANNCCTSGPDMWRSDASPTIPGWSVESPYLDHTNGGLWKKEQCEDMCRTDSQCNSWMWRNSASSCYLSTYTELKEYRPNPGYNDHHPHKFSRGCTNTPTTSPTKTPTTFAPTTFAPTSPAERCENYCQNSCAQFGSPEDNVSECQGCDSSKACHPGASNYNSVEAWCTFYACDSVNSRCDNWRCTQPSNAPTTTKTPTTTPTTSPTPPFEGKSGKSGDSEEESSEDYYGCETGDCHIVEDNNDCNVDEKMVAICNGEGIWGDFCILNDNIHESCFGETPVPTATNTPTNLPPTPSPVSSQCSPGCPDNWPGDGECDVSCFNSACNYDDGDCPTFAPTNLPTTSSPTRRPTQQPTTTSPTRRPTQRPTTYSPTQRPTQRPTTTSPTQQPTRQPTPDSVSYMQGGASARSTEENGESNAYLFPYIIGAFNMIIAILSALHTFLKYDALEDRHQQYSRHFGNLQVDLETLLAKPIEQRGSAGTMVERYKIKYSVLINNAPDLPENLERRCCGPEEVHAIEMT